MLNMKTIQRLLNQGTVGSRDVLITYLQTERKRLQNRQYYMKRVAQKEGLNYDTIENSDTIQSLKSDVKEVNTLIKQLRAKNKDQTKQVQSVRILHYTQKKQVERERIKNEPYQDRSVKSLIMSISNNSVQRVLESMFYRGKLAGLDESMINKFDKLLNKFGFNLTNDLKEAIRNAYKEWGSDTAIIALSNIVETYNKKIDTNNKLSEAEKIEAFEIIDDIRMITGV